MPHAPFLETVRTCCAFRAFVSLLVLVSIACTGFTASTVQFLCLGADGHSDLGHPGEGSPYHQAAAEHRHGDAAIGAAEGSCSDFALPVVSSAQPRPMHLTIQHPLVRAIFAYVHDAEMRTHRAVPPHVHLRPPTIYPVHDVILVI